MFERAVEKIIEVAEKNSTHREGDYIGEEGLLYCGICHTRKQMKSPLSPKPVRCMCKHEIEEEEAQKKTDLAKKLREECFPDKLLYSYTFENADTGSAEIVNKAKFYVDHFDEYYKKGLGMVFHGGVGCGKTYASACIANALVEKGVSCYMTDILRINREWSDFSKSKEAILERLKSFPLLILDDLGTERKSEAMYEMVYTVINERLKTRKPTIITTNITIEEFISPEEASAERIYSRLYEMCIPIACKGMTDRRKNKMISNLTEFEERYAQSGAKK